MQVYNPLSDKWSTVAPLPQPLDQAAAAALYDDKLYVVSGGYLDRNILSQSIYLGAYIPTARGALTPYFINGILYVGE